MKRPEAIEGVYAADTRMLEYWTQCENCPDRKGCKHMCDHPGWMRFLVDGQRKVFWSGIITLRKIKGTVKDYLETDPPEDVAMPLEQMRLWRQDGLV